MEIKNIKRISLENDNHIDHLECVECGASLKHALMINGSIYGLDCGAKILGWTTRSKAAINKKLYAAEYAIDRFRRVMVLVKKNDYRLDYAAIDAGRVCEALDLKFSRLDPDFLNKVLAAVGEA